MSEEFEFLDVTVHRVQVDNMVIKVPRGWRPVATSREFAEVVTQAEKLRPDSAKTWRPQEGKRVWPSTQWRLVETEGIPYHIDAREIIAKMPNAPDAPDAPDVRASSEERD